MKFSQDRIGLQEEIAVEHAECEDDCEGTTEAVRPLKWWVRSKTEDGHKNGGKENKKLFVFVFVRMVMAAMTVE
jgi:hypothetical protein